MLYAISRLQSTITLIRPKMEGRRRYLDTDLCPPQPPPPPGCVVIALLSKHLCRKQMKSAAQPGGQIAAHFCQYSRIIPLMSKGKKKQKAGRPLFPAATSEKQTIGGPGIAAVLLRPRVSHKGPPLHSSPCPPPRVSIPT